MKLFVVSLHRDTYFWVQNMKTFETYRRNLGCEIIRKEIQIFKLVV